MRSRRVEDYEQRLQGQFVAALQPGKNFFSLLNRTKHLIERLISLQCVLCPDYGDSTHMSTSCCYITSCGNVDVPIIRVSLKQNR